MHRFTTFVAAQFGNPSGWAGRWITVLMNVMNRALYRRVERELIALRPDSVLDVGFGNGVLVSRLARRLAARMICGIDISDDMVENASRRCRNAIASGRVELVAGNVMRLPFPDAAFEAVYTVNTLYFWPDAAAGFREIGRVMKPGATLLLAGYEKTWLESWSYTRYGFSLYTDQQIETLLERAGLTLRRKTVVARGKSYCMIVEKK